MGLPVAVGNQYVGLNTLGKGTLKVIENVSWQAALTVANWLRVKLNSKAVGAKIEGVILPERINLETTWVGIGANTRQVGKWISAELAPLQESLEKTYSGSGEMGDVRVWGSLGDIEFDLHSAPTKLTGSEGVKYVQHAIIGDKPHVQFTGRGLRSIRLPIAWHTSVMEDIEASFEALRTAMNEQTILPLVIGGNESTDTYFAGNYVIQSLPYEITKYTANGKVMILTATIELLEWNTGGPLEPGEHAPTPAVKKPGQAPSPGQQVTSTVTPGADMVLVKK